MAPLRNDRCRTRQKYPDRAAGWLLAGSFLWGVVMVAYNVVNAGLAAELTPLRLMGRVAATRRTLTMGIVPLGSLTGRLSSDHAGVPVAVIAWIVLTAGGAVVATAPTARATGTDQ